MKGSATIEPKIYRSDHDGLNKSVVVNNSANLQSIAAGNNNVYFTDEDGDLKKWDGSSVTTLNSSVASVGGLGVNSSNLFFGSAGSVNIYNLDGTSAGSFSLGSSNDIIYDSLTATESNVYVNYLYGFPVNGDFRRYNLDGTNEIILATREALPPRKVALNTFSIILEPLKYTVS